MNSIVTSKEAILLSCRNIVSEKGLTALSMRTVAQECNVALGSLYNYFSSKEELVTSTIESVWQDIFHMESCNNPEIPFPDYVMWIFERVKKGTVQYPNFFTAHSIGFASSGKGQAKEAMGQYFVHMKQGMGQVLQLDNSVKEDVFSNNFSQADFIDFVLMSLVSVLVQQQSSCNVLIEVIRRTIY